MRRPRCLPLRPPVRIPPSSLRRVAGHIGAPLTIRNWNAASPFGGDPRDAVALLRHRSKIQLVRHLAGGAHSVLIQERRGTASDLIQLHDILPGWVMLGSFSAQGTSGGVLLFISPLVASQYPERIFMDIVPGRVALARLRAPRSPPIDVANVHSYASLGRTRLQQISRLRRALSPLSGAAGEASARAASTSTSLPSPRPLGSSCPTFTRWSRRGTAACKLEVVLLGHFLEPIGCS